jgi:hypothetical protein
MNSPMHGKSCFPDGFREAVISPMTARAMKYTATDRKIPRKTNGLLISAAR